MIVSIPNDPADLALHIIAKRKHPEFQYKNPVHWISRGEPDEMGERDFHCLVCDEFIYHEKMNGWIEPESGPVIREHRIRHLKEHNLLAFI